MHVAVNFSLSKGHAYIFMESTSSEDDLLKLALARESEFEPKLEPIIQVWTWDMRYGSYSGNPLDPKFFRMSFVSMGKCDHTWLEILRIKYGYELRGYRRYKKGDLWWRFQLRASVKHSFSDEFILKLSRKEKPLYRHSWGSNHRDMYHLPIVII